MQKIWVLLITLTMIFTFFGCSEKDNNNNSDIETSKSDLDSNETIDWGEVESAMDILESLKPEGWDENTYGAYIYDVYDSDVLPDCIPEQIEGTLVYDTSLKDYEHDVINGNYGVGPIYYESHEDYRQYGVSFYANKEHLEQFIAELEANGMHGYMDGDEEAFGSGLWWEGFYGGNGWAIYLMYNTNDDHDGEYDGCLNVAATEDLYELPESIAGIPLPQTGIVTYDYNYYTIQDFTNGYEDKDFDLKTDAFPAEYYAAWFDYYCVARQDAVDYFETLVNNGWALEYEYSDEEDDYCMVLKKDNVYAIVDYEDSYMEIGFSDMVESLTY